MGKEIFQNKFALVTGGSSGIGLAFAKELAARGAHVCILARRKELLETAQQEILASRKSNDQEVSWISADISSSEQFIHALQQLPVTPDILINSAGIASVGFVHEASLKAYREIMDINFMGTVQAVKSVLPGMMERKSGVIINVSSFLGVVSFHGYSMYSATKYAIRGFTDALRAEVHRQGIQVAIVFPDDTDTPQYADEIKHRPEIAKAVWGEGKPMSPEKVARDTLNGVAKGHYMIVPGLKTSVLFDVVFLAGRRIHHLINLLESIGLRSLRSKKQ